MEGYFEFKANASRGKTDHEGANVDISHHHGSDQAGIDSDQLRTVKTDTDQDRPATDHRLSMLVCEGLGQKYESKKLKMMKNEVSQIDPKSIWGGPWTSRTSKNIILNALEASRMMKKPEK